MPRISEKSELLEGIIIDTLHNIIWAESDQQINQLLENCVQYFGVIISKRYIGCRDIRVPKSNEWFTSILPNYDDFRFKACLRVSRTDFHHILMLIAPNPIFHATGNKPKIPMELQLAIALYRFGQSGTGSSYFRVGAQFGSSDGGAIINSTSHVIQALLCLKDEFIHWPNADERLEIEKYMENRLPKCIGYLDGSHIPLYEAPVDDHESYFSRKQQYGIQIQAVCDNSLLIRDAFVGYPASVHDSRVFNNSNLGTFSEKFLTAGQWLSADSAYKLTEYVITPFRENASTGTADQRRKFNRHFSGYRVKIEQTFGILKAIFSSLKCLRVRVDKIQGHKRACEWIMACCILYNIIRPTLDLSTYILLDLIDETTDNDVSCNSSTVQGERKRNDIFRWVNNLDN